MGHFGELCLQPITWLVLKQLAELFCTIDRQVAYISQKMHKDAPYFPDYKSRFFPATAAAWLILRCDFSMLLNVGWKPSGYWLTAVSLQWVALMVQSHALCKLQTKPPSVGKVIDPWSDAEWVPTGPVFWVVMAVVAAECRAKWEIWQDTINTSMRQRELKTGLFCRWRERTGGKEQCG